MLGHSLSHIPFNKLTQPSDVAKIISAQVTSNEMWATGNIYNLDDGESVVTFHTDV